MLNRLFFPAMAALALAMVALAMVWPQGLGDRSPGPFGFTPVQRTPEMQAAMQREHEAAQRRLTQAREALSEMQTHVVSPTR